jgi:hypothetical protein
LLSAPLLAFAAGCAASSLRYDGIATAAYTPAFSYRILEARVRLSGYKKIYAGNADSLKARAALFNKNNFPFVRSTCFDGYLLPRQNTGNRPYRAKMAFDTTQLDNLPVWVGILRPHRAKQYTAVSPGNCVRRVSVVLVDSE